MFIPGDLPEWGPIFVTPELLADKVALEAFLAVHAKEIEEDARVSLRIVGYRAERCDQRCFFGDTFAIFMRFERP
jgi:hypothetical protein